MPVPDDSLTLPAEMHSIREARRFLQARLEDWSADGYDVAAAQVVSELAANAVLHAHTVYTVHVRWAGGSLLVEVSDLSPLPPKLRHYELDATTGRGLHLVDALSDNWGVRTGAPGKTVWARIRPDAPSMEIVVDEAGDEAARLPHQAHPATARAGCVQARVP